MSKNPVSFAVAWDMRSQDQDRGMLKFWLSHALLGGGCLVRVAETHVNFPHCQCQWQWQMAGEQLPERGFTRDILRGRVSSTKGARFRSGGSSVSTFMPRPRLAEPRVSTFRQGRPQATLLFSLLSTISEERASVPCLAATTRLKLGMLWPRLIRSNRFREMTS